MMAIAMCLVLLCSCNLYDGKEKKLGGLSLRLNSAGDRAMVESWTWSGNLEDTLIEIPDMYEKTATIDALGGSVGANASIQMFTIRSESGVQFKAESSKDQAVGDLVFTLKLGKNIRALDVDFSKSQFAQVTAKDGSSGIYRICIRVECSDENQTFYSKDGKLYRRNGDTLVTGIPYPQ
jgi:hypothetical protein